MAPCVTGGRLVYGSRSRHPAIVQISLCDGSSRVVNDTIDVTIWQNLGSSQDGNAIGDY